MNPPVHLFAYKLIDGQVYKVLLFKILAHLALWNGVPNSIGICHAIIEINEKVDLAD